MRAARALFRASRAMLEKDDAAMDIEGLIPVGKITGVHGIKGEVRIMPFEGMDWLDITTVFLSDASGFSPAKGIAILRMRRQGGHFVAALEGYGTREDALALAGRRVCVRKKDLPLLPDGEYYLHELEGMEVWTDDRRLLGRVVNILSTGANDVIECEGASGIVLIPAIDQTIKEVSLAHRKITVHLMEGLEESNTAKRRDNEV